MRFVAVDLPEANELTIHIMAAMAEHEGKAISARTKAALAAAKARGVKLGGYRWNIAPSAKARTLSLKARRAKIALWASDLLPVVRDIQTSGPVSLRGIAAVLNERGIPTVRGKLWTAAQVQRLLDLG